ncbi:MAG: C40 family peptidase [Chloroflexota bacterium]|nr:C40 family peptidase [Chloroflexota bacterium]
MTASDTGHAAASTTSPRLTPRNPAFGSPVVRKLTVLICALGLLASTGAGTLAAPASVPGVDTQAAAQVGGGQYIADFALQFQGYPYVWAGNGPGGFDCSGFTQYVLLNTVGIDIGHGVAEQTYSGAWVDWGEWQPGDLVYFAGTYRAGISHTGVYIGDGQFIHAENEGTGVVISSVYSDYYVGHYYGAYRHW